MAFASTPIPFPVFVCYAHKDNDDPDRSKRWLDRLLEHLEPLGLQNLVSTWSDQRIEAGEFWDANIQTQLQQAKAAVLLVSPAFLASKYIRNSELPVLLKRAMDRGLTILPIILKPCLFAETRFKAPDPQTGPEEFSLAGLQAIHPLSKPLSGMSEYEQDQVLLAVAQRLLKLVEEAPLPSTRKNMAGAIHNLPFDRNPFFTGRKEILDRLHGALNAGSKAALPQAISGLGGTGKTQTAVEYAYRYREEYDHIFWSKADTHLSLTAGFVEIAKLLNLQQKDAQEQYEAVKAVKRWLEENQGWLLILDNADDLKLVRDYLPSAGMGHIVLTTRAHAVIEVARRVEIKQMIREEGVLFLLRRAGVIAKDAHIESALAEDCATAEEIWKEMDGLPLALDQAGAFIEETPSSLAEYLGFYKARGARLLKVRGGLSNEHPSVTITFSLAFEKLEERNRAAADLVRVCAFLSPDAIPEEIFIKGGEELGAELKAVVQDQLELVGAIGEAGRYSLIQRDAVNHTIDIHRLVQVVVRGEMDSDAGRLWAERVVRAVNRAFPDVEIRNWPMCDRLLSHARVTASLIENWNFEFQEAARLLHEAALYCKDRGQYAKAAPLYQRALVIREKVLGPEHRDVAMTLNNLALLYEEQGNYAAAEPLLKQCLAIREKTLGPEHRDVVMALNNLADLYRELGMDDEAEPLLKRSLAILERILGAEHPDVAMGLNSLARLYKAQGKFTDAETLYLRSLAIRETALGKENPYVANTLGNLGVLYSLLDRYAEAESMFKRSLVIRETTLGSEHPDLAKSLNNLARLYDAQEKYAEAEALYQQALAIREKAFGPDHPYVAESLEDYALLLRKTERESEAEIMETRIKAIRDNKR